MSREESFQTTGPAAPARGSLVARRHDGISHAALIRLIKNQDIRLAKDALTREKINNINGTEPGSSWSALHYATFGGHDDLVKSLLAAGADVSLSTVPDVTAYNITIISNPVSIIFDQIREALNQNKPVEDISDLACHNPSWLQLRVKHKYPILELICKKNRVDVLEDWVKGASGQRDEIDLESIDFFKYVCDHSAMGMLRWALNQGIDLSKINIKTHSGPIPLLHYAVQSGAKSEFVEALIDEGVSLIQRNEGKYAFQLDCKSGNVLTHIIQQMVNKYYAKDYEYLQDKIDKNKTWLQVPLLIHNKINSLLMIAFQEYESNNSDALLTSFTQRLSKEELCEILMDIGTPVASLHRLASKSFCKSIAWQLDKGVPVDLLNNSFETPIMQAVYFNRFKAMKFLHKSGADLNFYHQANGIRSDDFMELGSLLHLASAVGAAEIVDYLLKNDVIVRHEDFEQYNTRKNLPKLTEVTALHQKAETIGRLKRLSSRIKKLDIDCSGVVDHTLLDDLEHLELVDSDPSRQYASYTHGTGLEILKKYSIDVLTNARDQISGLISAQQKAEDAACIDAINHTVDRYNKARRSWRVAHLNTTLVFKSKEVDPDKDSMEFLKNIKEILEGIHESVGSEIRPTYIDDTEGNINPLFSGALSESARKALIKRNKDCNTLLEQLDALYIKGMEAKKEHLDIEVRNFNKNLALLKNWQPHSFVLTVPQDDEAYRLISRRHRLEREDKNDGYKWMSKIRDLLGDTSSDDPFHALTIQEYPDNFQNLMDCCSYIICLDKYGIQLLISQKAKEEKEQARQAALEALRKRGESVKATLKPAVDAFNSALVEYKQYHVSHSEFQTTLKNNLVSLHSELGYEHEDAHENSLNLIELHIEKLGHMPDEAVADYVEQIERLEEVLREEILQESERQPLLDELVKQYKTLAEALVSYVALLQGQSPDANVSDRVAALKETLEDVGWGQKAVGAFRGVSLSLGNISQQKLNALTLETIQDLVADIETFIAKVKGKGAAVSKARTEAAEEKRKEEAAHAELGEAISEARDLLNVLSQETKALDKALDQSIGATKKIKEFKTALKNLFQQHKKKKYNFVAIQEKIADFKTAVSEQRTQIQSKKEDYEAACQEKIQQERTAVLEALLESVKAIHQGYDNGIFQPGFEKRLDALTQNTEPSQLETADINYLKKQKSAADNLLSDLTVYVDEVTALQTELNHLEDAIWVEIDEIVHSNDTKARTEFTDLSGRCAEAPRTPDTLKAYCADYEAFRQQYIIDYQSEKESCRKKIEERNGEIVALLNQHPDVLEKNPCLKEEYQAQLDIRVGDWSLKVLKEKRAECTALREAIKLDALKNTLESTQTDLTKLISQLGRADARHKEFQDQLYRLSDECSRLYERKDHDGLSKKQKAHEILKFKIEGAIRSVDEQNAVIAALKETIKKRFVSRPKAPEQFRDAVAERCKSNLDAILALIKEAMQSEDEGFLREVLSRIEDYKDTVTQTIQELQTSENARVEAKQNLSTRLLEVSTTYYRLMPDFSCRLEHRFKQLNQTTKAALDSGNERALSVAAEDLNRFVSELKATQKSQDAFIVHQTELEQQFMQLNSDIKVLPKTDNNDALKKRAADLRDSLNKCSNESDLKDIRRAFNALEREVDQLQMQEVPTKSNKATKSKKKVNLSGSVTVHKLPPKQTNNTSSGNVSAVSDPAQAAPLRSAQSEKTPSKRGGKKQQGSKSKRTLNNVPGEKTLPTRTTSKRRRRQNRPTSNKANSSAPQNLPTEKNETNSLEPVARTDNRSAARNARSTPVGEVGKVETFDVPTTSERQGTPDNSPVPLPPVDRPAPDLGVDSREQVGNGNTKNTLGSDREQQRMSSQLLNDIQGEGNVPTGTTSQGGRRQNRSTSNKASSSAPQNLPTEKNATNSLEPVARTDNRSAARNARSTPVGEVGKVETFDVPTTSERQGAPDNSPVPLPPVDRPAPDLGVDSREQVGNGNTQNTLGSDRVQQTLSEAVPYNVEESALNNPNQFFSAERDVKPLSRPKSKTRRAEAWDESSDSESSNVSSRSIDLEEELEERQSVLMRYFTGFRDEVINESCRFLKRHKERLTRLSGLSPNEVLQIEALEEWLGDQRESITELINVYSKNPSAENDKQLRVGIVAFSSQYRELLEGLDRHGCVSYPGIAIKRVDQRSPIKCSYKNPELGERHSSYHGAEPFRLTRWIRRFFLQNPRSVRDVVALLKGHLAYITTPCLAELDGNSYCLMTLERKEGSLAPLATVKNDWDKKNKNKRAKSPSRRRARSSASSSDSSNISSNACGFFKPSSEVGFGADESVSSSTQSAMRLSS